MDHRRKLIIVIAGLLLPLLILACLPQTTTMGPSTTVGPPGTANQAFINASYKTLITAVQVYDTGMNTAGYLYKQGQITPAQKDQIISIATKYDVAWHAAQKALEEYKTSETAANKASLEQAIDSFTASQTELLNLLNAFLGGKK